MTIPLYKGYYTNIGLDCMPPLKNRPSAEWKMFQNICHFPWGNFNKTSSLMFAAGREGEGIEWGDLKTIFPA